LLDYVHEKVESFARGYGPPVLSPVRSSEIVAARA